MPKNMGTCRLFQKEAKLVKAHIIPEWVFREARGGDAFLIYIKDEEPHPKRSPIGPYDSNILSLEAEHHLAKFDDYASQFFRKPPPRNINKQMKGNGECGYYEIQDYDYERLNLFVISVIWRASISKMDEYRMIDLGPKYEELARQAILNSDCEDESLFPMMIWRHFPHKKIKDGKRIMFDPLEKKRADGVNFFILKILDWWLWMKVDQRSMPLHIFKKTQLSKGLSLRVVMVSFEALPDYERIKAAVESHRAFRLRRK